MVGLTRLFKSRLDWHTVATVVLLTLALSHLFDYRMLWLLIAGAWLVDWQSVRFYRTDITILALFVVTVDLTWYRLDNHFLENFRFYHTLFLFLSYLIGLTFAKRCLEGTNKTDLCLIFGLYVPVAWYIVLLFGSYLLFPQDSSYMQWGMQVWYPNEYARLHVNHGKLISTVIAYYLIAAVALSLTTIASIPFRKTLLHKALTVSAWVVLGLSLYFADLMMRRIVVALFVLLIAGFSGVFLWKRRRQWYRFIVPLFLGVLLVGAVVLSFLQETHIAHRLYEQGWHDRRFSFWIPGLKTIWEYPWGGGHGVYVGKDMRLTHNTWIDIGKDFGIVPFVLFVLFYAKHLWHLVRFWRDTTTFKEVKPVMTVLVAAVTIQLALEPVFTSDKVFMAYVMFVLGVLRVVSDRGSNTSTHSCPKAFRGSDQRP